MDTTIVDTILMILWSINLYSTDAFSDIDVSTYKDESDIFYEDPAKYLSTRFRSKATRVYGDDGLVHSPQHEKDSHIVFFEDLIRTHPDTPAWFENQGYDEVTKT